jgi:hypothetical protein
MIKTRSVLSLVLALFSANITAVVKADEPTKAPECVTIVNDAQRLACFDDLFQVHTVHQVKQNTSKDSLVFSNKEPSKAPPEPKDEKAFGAERIESVEDNAPDIITAQITKITKSKSNKRTFELDNGQVWREIKTSKLF